MSDDARDFGEYLRQARERKGISLREIATHTKISMPALEALERSDVARLPGGIFIRSFVRAYAKEVGLDPDDTVRRFVSQFPGADEEPVAYVANPERIAVESEPVAGHNWRGLGWILPLILFIAYFSLGGRLPWWRDQGAAVTPKVADHGAEPTPPPAAGPVLTTPAGQQAAANTVASPSAQPVSPAPDQSPSPGAAAPSAAVTQATTAMGPAGGGFRLSLAPRETCWVSVRVNGAPVFSGLMKAGERKDLELRGDVSLTVGNAGAFSFAINDQPGRALGTAGQVVTARITAENLTTYIEPR